MGRQAEKKNSWKVQRLGGWKEGRKAIDRGRQQGRAVKETRPVNEVTKEGKKEKTMQKTTKEGKKEKGREVRREEGRTEEGTEGRKEGEG
jgi:hypothetical protein